MSEPRISVVVPTLNAASRLPELLSALKNQTLIPHEVLVVDSESDDNTAEMAASSEGVRCKTVERSSFNHGITRHEALLDTSGEFVCFLTDDAVPADASFLERLVAPMADPKVALCSGRQLPKPDARRFEQLVRAYNYGPKSNVRSKRDLGKLGIKTFFASDACSIYRRSSYLEVGGFSRVNTNEDMLIAARFINAGYKVAYAADARVFHSHNLTPAQQYRRNKSIGFFLEEHASEFASAKEIGEGLSLVKTVALQLLREKELLEFIAFGFDCVARFAGNRAGRRLSRKTGGRL